MERILIFKRESKEIVSICSSDIKMKRLVNIVGDYTLTLRNDYFLSLVRSIIGQQLSIKTASTIWDRVIQISSDVNPDNILEIDDFQFRLAGVSNPKIKYIKELSKAVLTKEIDFSEFNNLENDMVINTLMRVKGIGRWTAEMFLIFSLGRLDVLATGDIGLQRAMRWLYGLDSDISSEYIQELGRKWSPYRTIASLYLWEIINRGYIAKDVNKILNNPL